MRSGRRRLLVRLHQARGRRARASRADPRTTRRSPRPRSDRSPWPSARRRPRADRRRPSARTRSRSCLAGVEGLRGDRATWRRRELEVGVAVRRSNERPSSGTSSAAGVSGSIATVARRRCCAKTALGGGVASSSSPNAKALSPPSKSRLWRSRAATRPRCAAPRRRPGSGAASSKNSKASSREAAGAGGGGAEARRGLRAVAPVRRGARAAAAQPVRQLRRGGRIREQALHALDQRLRLEGLRDVARGAGARGALVVEGLEGAGQQQHRNVSERRVGFDRFAHLVAALPRHHDVCEDHVGAHAARARDGVVTVVDRDERDVLAGEADPDHLLDRDAVVCEQQGLAHGPPGSGCERQAGPRAGAAESRIVAASIRIECFFGAGVQRGAGARPWPAAVKAARRPSDDSLCTGPARAGRRYQPDDPDRGRAHGRGAPPQRQRGLLRAGAAARALPGGGRHGRPHRRAARQPAGDPRLRRRAEGPGEEPRLADREAARLRRGGQPRDPRHRPGQARADRHGHHAGGAAGGRRPHRVRPRGRQPRLPDPRRPDPAPDRRSLAGCGAGAAPGDLGGVGARDTRTATC